MANTACRSFGESYEEELEEFSKLKQNRTVEEYIDKYIDKSYIICDESNAHDQ